MVSMDLGMQVGIRLSGMADMDTTTHGTLGIGIMPAGIRLGIAVGIRHGIMVAIMVATGVAIGDGITTTTHGTDQDGVEVLLLFLEELAELLLAHAIMAL